MQSSFDKCFGWGGCFWCLRPFAEALVCRAFAAFRDIPEHDGNAGCRDRHAGKRSCADHKGNEQLGHVTSAFVDAGAVSASCAACSCSGAGPVTVLPLAASASAIAVRASGLP